MDAMSPNARCECCGRRRREHGCESPGAFLALHRPSDQERADHIHQRVRPAEGGDERRRQNPPPLARRDINEPNSEAVDDI